MIKKIMVLFIGICYLTGYNAYSDIVGSDSSLSVRSFYTFPAKSSTANRIASLVIAKDGFALQNSSTSLIFDSLFPVSGTITLNNGTLILNRDLIFHNNSRLQNLGTIVGNNHIVSLSQSITSIPANAPIFSDTKLVLHNDVTLTGITTFTGMCSIEGNGHKLILGNAGTIHINGQLLVHNLTIDGIADKKIKCMNDTSLLILDDATWIQKADATFYLGAFQCRNNVLFKGNSSFSYQSRKTSVIKSQSTLQLDRGFTFNYDPIRSSSKKLLAFEDKSSSLILNGATLHANAIGLNLRVGSLFISGDSFLSSEVQSNDQNAESGITLGNGVDQASDMTCAITAGARLTLTHGVMNYKNMMQSSWTMENSVSMLHLGTHTILRLYNTMNLGYGIALCEDDVIIARKAEAHILGNVSAINNLFFTQL